MLPLPSLPKQSVERSLLLEVRPGKSISPATESVVPILREPDIVSLVLKTYESVICPESIQLVQTKPLAESALATSVDVRQLVQETSLIVSVVPEIAPPVIV